ncbi:hypothetical protein EMMF5_005702 [Cystobasidiomycetes sp. EMM_F5]
MSTEALNNTDSASSFISPVPAASRLGGVNIAGFEFGTNKSGYVGTNNYTIPSKNQIAHFVAAGSNVFRLPFGWQYMEPAGPGTGLGGVITSYDSYVQTILSAGAFVILDVHKSVRVLEPLTLLVDLFVLSYGRWDGAIIGSGGPTTMQFANLWSALAGKYANQTNVIFGIMNEPHDQDLVSWTVQVQAAVDAIRAAGATSQYILLPGIGYSAGGNFIRTNEPSLSTVTDPAGGTSLLVYDIHEYLDSDSTGTNVECVTDKISAVLAPVTAVLKSKGRKAFLSEIGGSSAESCQKYLNWSLAYIAANSEEWLGFTTWSAGAFTTKYVLSETPASDGTDQPIFANAVKPNLPGPVIASGT